MPEPWTPTSFSWLEKRFLKIMGDARLHGFIHNYAVEAKNRTYYIDFAHPDLHLGIEVDSKAFHSSESQIEHDAYRQTLLEDEGWQIVRFSSEDILRRPHEVKKRLKKLVEETSKNRVI